MSGKRGRPNKKEQLSNWASDFEKLRDPIVGKKKVKTLLKQSEKDLNRYLEPWWRFSKSAEHVYPSQGLLKTPYDYLDYSGEALLPQEILVKTLRLQRFFLELFNHPYRISFLEKVNNEKFVAPKKIKGGTVEIAALKGVSLAVGDLGASVVGDERERVSRKERYAQGPFVKLGRFARVPFTGSASPDVWNSAAAIATMAASLALAAIPRNGLLNSVERQRDLAKEVFERLKVMEEEILLGRSDRKKVASYWRRNVMGTLEASREKALLRARALWEVGVRSFRVYSPEPGTSGEEVVRELRKEFGKEIEIFAGQVVSVNQAKRLQEYGADGLYLGIGGGGRCITGVRSGSVIDWPELVWNLRGEIDIPIVVEGGASDHVAVTLLLGAAGISTSRVVAGGTVESPGGAMFFIDKEGKMFKPYGGEASARTKYLDGKLLPFDIPSFVEGETTKAKMSYVKFVYPTLTYNLHLLLEDAILAMVFRGVANLNDLWAINPSPLRRNTSMGDFQRNTH